MKEQVEGLVEEEAEEGEEEAASEEDVAVGAIVMAEKKTERQRRKERVEKLKVLQRFQLSLHECLGLEVSTILET